jgi:hypothetical protein
MDAIHLPRTCFPCGLKYELTFGKQTASQNLRMMSRALDNRLPPPESKIEYTPWNTFKNEDWLEDEEGVDKRESENEFVDLNFL